MNKRNFLKCLFGTIVAALVPVSIIRYDPVKRKIVSPINPDNYLLCGFKGSTFVEHGYVYAPYIPLMLSKEEYDKRFPEVDSDLDKYVKKAYPNSHHLF